MEFDPDEFLPVGSEYAEIRNALPFDREVDPFCRCINPQTVRSQQQGRLASKKFFSSMINKMQKPPPKKINPAMPMTSPNVPCGCTMTSRQESAAMIAAASVVPSNLRWLG